MGCLVALVGMGMFFYVLYSFGNGMGEGLKGLGLVIMFLLISFGLINSRETKKKEERDNFVKNRTNYILKKVKRNGFMVDQQYLYIEKNRQEGIFLDMDNRQIGFFMNGVFKKYPFQSILQVDLLADGVTETSTSRSSQIGGALVGGILAGGVGAIVGGMGATTKSTEKITNIQLKVSVNDLDTPVFLISFKESSLSYEKGSLIVQQAYKDAYHWQSILSQVIHHPNLISSNKSVSETKKQAIHRLGDVLGQVLEQKQLRPSTVSLHKTEQKQDSLLLVADEIRKLSELLKDGMITEEEFQHQKCKLLSS